MKMFAEENFEMMKKFALSSVEMINVRGGDGDGGDGEGGGGEGGDGSDAPEDPIVKIVI